VTFDFDKIIERRNTYSSKYNMAAYKKPADVLPLWVADMDFMAPPCVLDALAEQGRHGVFGYFNTGEPYFKVLQNWFSGHFEWNVSPDWLVKTPGIVNAIYVALMALTEPGDAVIIQQPVYYPFTLSVQDTGRKLVVNQLVNENNYYRIDFDDFEKKIIANNVKAFILCHPHNPVGRVWTREELVQLGNICLRHGVIVISDEIHQDFIYEGHKHLVFAGLGAEYCDITVTCTAPTKTFNLAGLPVANIFISNAKIREKFLRTYNRFGVTQLCVMGIVACQAAYAGGAPWLRELLGYLSGNMSLIGEFLDDRLPEIKFVKPEGTYLAWLDFRALGLGERELGEWVTNKARLWLHNGTIFGESGAGFMRLNAACPRSVLLEALERLERAMRARTG